MVLPLKYFLAPRPTPTLRTGTERIGVVVRLFACVPVQLRHLTMYRVTALWLAQRALKFFVLTKKHIRNISVNRDQSSGNVNLAVAKALFSTQADLQFCDLHIPAVRSFSGHLIIQRQFWAINVKWSLQFPRYTNNCLLSLSRKNGPLLSLSRHNLFIFSFDVSKNKKKMLHSRHRDRVGDEQKCWTASEAVLDVAL